MSNSICNVYKFSNTKTIKLLDTYSVELHLTNADMDILLPFLDNYEWLDKENKILTIPQCTSVTLPEVTLKTEALRFGNNFKLMAYPDLDQPSDLKLEFIETLCGNNKYIQNSNQPIQLIQLLVNLFLTKLFDAESFAYKLHDYIPRIIIYVFSNNFQTPVYKYEFTELKMTNNSKYTLDYGTSDACKWTLEFSYRSYTQWPLSDIASITTPNKMQKTSKSNTVSNTTINNEPLSEANTIAIDSKSNINMANNKPSDSIVDKNTNESISQNPTNIEAGLNSSTRIDVSLKGDNELILDPIEIHASSSSLSIANDDRIDELAYQMMRGNLGNGKSRKTAAIAQGYSMEEIKSAQAIVNQKDWDSLKARHDKRAATPQINDINDGIYNDVITPAQPKKIETTLKGDGFTYDINKPTITVKNTSPNGGLRSVQQLIQDSDKKIATLKTNPLDDISSFDRTDTLLNSIDNNATEHSQALPYKSDAEYQKAKEQYEIGKKNASDKGIEIGSQNYLKENPINSKSEQIWYDKHSQAWTQASLDESKRQVSEYERTNADTKAKLDLYESMKK